MVKIDIFMAVWPLISDFMAGLEKRIKRARKLEEMRESNTAGLKIAVLGAWSEEVLGPAVLSFNMYLLQQNQYAPWWLTRTDRIVEYLNLPLMLHLEWLAWTSFQEDEEEPLLALQDLEL